MHNPVLDALGMLSKSREKVSNAADAWTPDAAKNIETPSIRPKRRSLFSDNSAQMGGMDLPGVMIVLVIAGVVGFVGLQVMSTVISTTQLASGDPLYNASQSLETSINNAWGLVGVAFIVVILAVIIVYLYGLRGGR